MITEEDQKALDTPPPPTAEQLQAPVISYKDRKILMWLYDGKLRKAEKLRRLVRKGYCEVNSKNEIVPTVLGMLLIDFTIRQRNERKDARKRLEQKLNHKPSRKNRVNVFGQRKQRNTGTVPNGTFGSGNSGEVEHAAAAHLG